MPAFDARSETEDLIGAIDDVNVTFLVSNDYELNTVQVWDKGQFRPTEWTELPPRTIVFDIPPRAGSDLQAHYIRRQ